MQEGGVRLKLSAMDQLSDTLDRVRAKFPALGNAASRANKQFAVFSRGSEGFARSMKSWGNSAKGVGQAITVGVTLPVAAAIGMSIKQFADYETALVGVGKTTNLQGSELEAMGQQFIGMSKKIPVTVEELLGLGQTAAQLGVRGTADILKFSEVMAKLSRASNVKGEEGASDLARFITVTRSSIKDVDRYASALVALGNTSAATENEILGFALRLAGSTAVFNVSGQQALAYATTLRSVGIEAEAGSSSIQRALGGINEAIGKGGQKMQALSLVTGIAGGELAGAFKNNSSDVLMKFATGLDKLAKNGGDVSKALDYFGLSGVRDLQTLGALSQNTDVLALKLKTTAEAFRENTALEDEFSAASKTLANRFVLFKNQAGSLGIALGAKLAPVVNLAMKFFGGLFDIMGRWPVFSLIVLGIVGLVAALGPFLIIGGTLLTMIPAMVTGWGLLTAAMTAAGAAGWLAALPIILLVAKFVLIGLAIAAVAILVWEFREAIMDGILWPINMAIAAFNKLASLMLGTKISVPGFNNPFAEAPAGPGSVAPGAPAMVPSGAPIGGEDANRRINEDFQARTNNARVDVNFRNLPQNATVRSQNDGGMGSLNLGFVGT